MVKGYFEIKARKENLGYKHYIIEAYHSNGQVIDNIDAYRSMYCNGLWTREAVEDSRVKNELIRRMVN